MMGRITMFAALIGLASTMVSCGDDESTVDVQATVVAAAQATVVAMATPTPESIPPPAVLSTSASVRTDNSLIVEIGVSFDSPARVYVEYENNAAGAFVTRTTESNKSDPPRVIVEVDSEGN